MSFRKYDALVAQRALGREAVQLAGDQRGADITETLANMARMHRELINEHQTARPKQKAAVMAKIRELESDRRLLKQAANADTPEKSQRDRPSSGQTKRCANLGQCWQGRTRAQTKRGTTGRTLTQYGMLTPQVKSRLTRR